MMLTLVVAGDGRAESEGRVGYVWRSRGKGVEGVGGGRAAMEDEEGFMGVTGREWWVYQVNTISET
jgi:hypothetical protein